MSLLCLVACASQAAEPPLGASNPQAISAPESAQSSATPNPFTTIRFRDQQPLVNRLRRLQALPFVTVWDSREATVYVGVDRDGRTGLHLRQKRDDRGSRAANALARPEDVRRAVRGRGPRARTP